MVLASHVILGAYGFWLPNDPRGSWSDFIGAWELLRLGPATKTWDRRSKAYDFHDREKRLAAKAALKYPPVQFSGVQARAVGRGFAELAKKSRLTIWACSILPEHTHLVIARHLNKVEYVANQLKGAATRQLVQEGVHPMARYVQAGERPPKAWAEGQWKVFLDTPDEIAHAVEYVEQNPGKEALPPQTWSFVTKFDAHATVKR